MPMPETLAPAEVAPPAAPVDVPEPRPAPAASTATEAQITPDSAQPAAEADDTTATLAARLRALPRGGMAHRQAELREIAARVAALRDRLAGHRPGA